MIGEFDAGSGTFQIPIEGRLEPGLYQLRIFDNNNQSIVKLIVK